MSHELDTENSTMMMMHPNHNLSMSTAQYQHNHSSLQEDSIQVPAGHQTNHKQFTDHLISQSIHEEPERVNEHFARDSIYEAEGENSSVGMLPDGIRQSKD